MGHYTVTIAWEDGTTSRVEVDAMSGGDAENRVADDLGSNMDHVLWYWAHGREAESA